ncbi:MAG: TIGR03619 family F420-dependent LLM class oxidoreductase [Actinomycetota bacterium]|jgi:probable F420-dependent oxidoreductase|nr:TIGR03619 family F420-dependent LLM class oxidoreductase [Actinomycetota bacterium]
MHFDLWVPTAAPFATPDLLSTLGQEADARGIHRIWVGEHVVLFDQYHSRYPYAEDGRIPAPPGTGLLEPLSTLTFLAAHTRTVRLGTAMMLLPQRNPVYTAKEVATLDWLSNGRVDLGVGVGWLEEEFEAVAVPWERRGARADDYLEVLRTLWCEDPSEFHGEAYDLPKCSMFPKPLQRPAPPIHIGGESAAALRRVARAGQGWHTFNRLPEDLAHPLGVLETMLADRGRHRREIQVTVCPYFQELTPERVDRYAEAGADAIAALFFAESAAGVPAALDALAPCVERASAC